MFVSKAGCNQRCQNLFFFSPGWTTHSLSHSFSSFLLCLLFYGGGQMRSRLPLPIETVSVHLHSIHKQIAPAQTSEPLPQNNKQNWICILKFRHSVRNLLLSASALFHCSLPPRPALSQLQQGWTLTLCLVWICQGWSVHSLCVRVCACFCGELFFSQNTLSECESGERERETPMVM